ncbi:TlpA disulfide reductase family protein [Paucibacter sp. APW11]|uniref:TlpA disulfide reductase family protein n=1 Tax=Roseateles aquae TaxID=3077235 RepID=A0ABU3PBW9_9BURK|nr:TlpA disulfide reductase family protein [Paucibacter sp. APW11]MDT9000040.1 TlpA disulfide reductase family protein [Paucibacter sp. APW11]
MKSITFRRTLLALLAPLFLTATPLQAQVPAAGLPAQAVKLSGERFNADQLKGKVTMVFYWATSCAVCRDSLPELRANLRGWRDKPFALLTVNVDKQAAEWKDYETIVAATQKATPPGLISVRQEGAVPFSGRLPVTLLLDAKGKVVARYEGRIAPEAWDGIADLLP